MPVKSLIDSLRPLSKKQRVAVEDVVDQRLDDALQRLAEATECNEVMCERVRVRQSSGKIKIVPMP